MLPYDTITNSFVGNFGELNRACSRADKVWTIRKIPHEQSYMGWVGGVLVEAELCDDLFEKMIEIAN